MHPHELHEFNELSRAVHLIGGKGKKFTFTCADAPLTTAPAQLADDDIAHRSLRRSPPPRDLDQ